jgi:hypothetical protein
MKSGLPKIDMVLASASVAPIATAPLIEGGADSHAVRFFLAPLCTFTWNGRDVFLTAPDALALASSFVLGVRFLTWALAPLWRRTRGKAEEGEE